MSIRFSIPCFHLTGSLCQAWAFHTCHQATLLQEETTSFFIAASFISWQFQIVNKPHVSFEKGSHSRSRQSLTVSWMPRWHCQLKDIDLAPNVWLHSSVGRASHRIVEVTGSNPVEALIFFRLLPSNCLNKKIYCDDHSSLSSTTQYKYEFHMKDMYFLIFRCKIQFSRSWFLYGSVIGQKSAFYPWVQKVFNGCRNAKFQRNEKQIDQCADNRKGSSASMSFNDFLSNAHDIPSALAAMKHPQKTANTTHQ